MNDIDMEGPQPPAVFEPTMHLRWKVSSRPGYAPTLQQLWRCLDTEAVDRGSVRATEWRDVDFVDWNERPVV